MTIIAQFVRVDLLPEEIELFKLFREYQDIFKIIASKEIKGGSIEIHFDKQGNLMKIEKKETLYQRGKEI